VIRGYVSKVNSGKSRGFSKWLNRFTWLICVAALLLICSGGMVTSKNVGLAVPDWPTTFGYNMFLFPVSKWVGGILFEHTHRLIASAVGFLTIVLTIWLWRSESRRWVRNLGLIALAGVILQGILGGLRVTMLKDEIGIFHACVAQAFLALLVVIALVTTSLWRSLGEIDINPKKFAPIRTLAIAITVAIYVQLALGSVDSRFSHGKRCVDSRYKRDSPRQDQRLARCARPVGRGRFPNLASNVTPFCRASDCNQCHCILFARLERRAPGSVAQAIVDLVGRISSRSADPGCMDNLEQ